MLPALNLPLSSKKRKFDASSLEAGGVIADKVQFERRGLRVEASVEYPKKSPSVDTDQSLLTEVSADPKVVYCPGCSNQDVTLERCHENVLTRHLRTKYPHKQPPKAVGMQGIFLPEEMIALIDDPDHFFIGRRPPRGVPTKSIGVQKTLKRSIYANPFIVSKNGFELGESLKLYEHWLAVDARPLTAQEVQQIVNEAPKLPETLEEMMLYYPQLLCLNED